MLPSNEFGVSRREFDRLWGLARELIDTNAALPEWPFVATTGQLDYFDSEWLRDENFGEFLQTIAREHGDDDVAIVMVDSWPSVYVDFVQKCGRWPGLKVSTNRIAPVHLEITTQYAQGGSVDVMLDFQRALFFGEGGQWAVWLDFEGELGIVFSRTSTRPWRSIISFADRLDDLLPCPVGHDRDGASLDRYRILLTENIASRNRPYVEPDIEPK